MNSDKNFPVRINRIHLKSHIMRDSEEPEVRRALQRSTVVATYVKTKMIKFRISKRQGQQKKGKKTHRPNHEYHHQEPRSPG
jgi:hypothetical protein